MEEAWLVNPTWSGCASVCSPRACPATGSPVSVGHCQPCWNHSSWEPGLKHSPHMAKWSEVICCRRGCICCASLAWKPFLPNSSEWNPLSALRLPKEFDRREAKKPWQSISVLSSWHYINLASYYTWGELEVDNTVVHTALPVFLTNGYFGFPGCPVGSSLRAFFFILKYIFPFVALMAIMLVPWDLKCSSS